MAFSQQLAIAEQRANKVGDFDDRWRQVQAQLPESFAISANADNSASLHYQKWIESENGSASLESIPVFPCIEQSARVLSMVEFCKVLKAYGLLLKMSVPMYRVCIPQ